MEKSQYQTISTFLGIKSERTETLAYSLSLPLIIYIVIYISVFMLNPTLKLDQTSFNLSTNQNKDNNLPSRNDYRMLFKQGQ